MKSHISKEVAIKLFILLLITFNVRVGLSQNSRLDARDTVAIICVNDFHGAFVPDIKQGILGAGILYTTVNALKRKYPMNLVIAVGDNFGGSYFSNRNQGKLLPRFFERLGVRVSAIGNHEFDNGIEFLEKKWSDCRPKDWNISYICANLYKKGTKEIPSYLIPDTVCVIKTSDNKEIKVRLIGLVTQAVTSTSKCTDVGSQYTIDGIYNARLAEIFKQDTASVDINVLAAHIGTKMDGMQPKWNEAHLDSLPSELMAIASGHSHETVVGWIKDANTKESKCRPIIQGGVNGQHVGLLLFERDGNRWIPCDPQVLKCEPREDESEFRKVIDWEVTQELEQVEESTGMRLKDKLVCVSDAIVHNRSVNKTSLTALGSYVCMSYANAYREYSNTTNIDHIVVAFSHFGGIRRSLYPGKARVVDIGEILPFESDLVAYKLTGKQIRKIVEAGFNNSHGKLQMNNLRVDYVTHQESDGKTTYKILNVHYLVPGKSDIILNDGDVYPVVVDSFITTGGDGYPMELFAGSKIEGFKAKTTPSFLKFVKNLGSDMTRNYLYKATENFVGEY